MKPIVHTLIAALSMATLTGCDFPGANASSSGKALEPAGAKVTRQGTTVAVPEGAPLRQTLRVAAVEQRTIESPIAAPGVIEALPDRLVKITPPLSGRVVKLHRLLGDAVKAGEPLFTLDSSDLSTVNSEYAKARAAAAQAQLDLARQKILFDADIAPKKEYEASQLAAAAAEADARASADKLAQLGVVPGAASRRDYVLRSPIAGRVIDMAGAQGGYWNDINAPIMTVADLSVVWLTASVSEKDIAQLFVGQAARITLNAYADKAFEGKVKYVGEVLDPDTRTVKVRVVVDNKDGRFRPGMFARVTFAGERRDGIVVPPSALLQSGLVTRVFVEKSPFTYEPRVVTAGAALAGGVEITSGLQAGERIVVKEGVLLND